VVQLADPRPNNAPIRTAANIFSAFAAKIFLVSF
jgi:hypothetical protein